MRHTREQVLEVLNYDKDNGLLRWKVPRGSTVKAGDIAGTETTSGALQMSLLGQRVQVSHVIWFLETNEWVRSSIDHIDRNQKNNRFGNLRTISPELITLLDIHKNSNEGIYQTTTKKFAVVIRKAEESICVGSYSTKKFAIAVFDACKLVM